MTTIAPNKLILTCTVTGKVVTWTNRTIIQSKIDQFGSLEAFVAQYKSKGAGKSDSIAAKVMKAPVIKSICEQGVELGKMTPGQYQKSLFGKAKPATEEAPVEYVTRRYENKDGTITSVTAPKPRTNTMTK